MNQEQYVRMHEGQGFIAALDQSGGSTPKALALYGVSEDKFHNDEEMYTLIHEMRTRIIKSEAFTSDQILGAILFENTMDRKIDDLYTADYLWNKKGIIPFLKVDQGLAEEHAGVQLMKPIPNLDALLVRANERNIFGTKMRSVIKEANEAGIKKIVEQQFEIAKQIANAGLVPILEPEVDINSKDKAESEVILLKYIKEQLALLDADIKVMFKVSIPSVDEFYSELMKDAHVVRVVALSGGYTRDDANERLIKNPGLIASFSRALSQGLYADQSQAEFDGMLKEAINSIYLSSIK